MLWTSRKPRVLNAAYQRRWLDSLFLFADNPRSVPKASARPRVARPGSMNGLAS